MVMTRISQIIKAYVYEGLEKLEDPVLMVKQYIRDINIEIKKLKETIKKQDSFDKQLCKQLEEAKELITRREEQANLAIQAGEDDLARKILKSKKAVEEQVNQYELLISKNKDELKERKEELEKLLFKYEQVKERNADLIVRVQGMRANQQMEKFEKAGEVHSLKGDEDELAKNERELDIENELNLLKEKNR